MIANSVMIRILAISIMTILALVAATGAAMAQKTTLEDVAADLICQCGCNKLLSVCEMTGWAIPAKELIKEKLAKGETKEQIIAYFVKEYGEKILAAPPKKGFNLTAWLTPFFTIGGAGGVIVTVVMSWSRFGRRKKDEDIAKPGTIISESDAKYREELQEELKKFDY